MDKHKVPDGSGQSFNLHTLDGFQNGAPVLPRSLPFFTTHLTSQLLTAVELLDTTKRFPNL